MTSVVELNENNADGIIRTSWASVANLVEDGHPLSSEKTLCFLFAMEIWKQSGGRIQLDFENQCYGPLQGKSKYLDLLIATDKGFKVAIEFKLPQRSKTGNSNQTQTRVAIYRDLARLNWLKSNSIKPDACYFLMATNENPYINNSNINEFPQFITRHGHTIEGSNNLEVDELAMFNLNCRFHWNRIGDSMPFRKSGNYAWLEPIQV